MRLRLTKTQKKRVSQIGWRERLTLFVPQQFEVLVQFVDLARRHQAFQEFIPSLEQANERLQRYYANSAPEH